MDLPIFYREAEDWSGVLLLYDSALKEINTKLEILNNEFKVAHQYNPIEHITSRIKTPESIAKKLRHNNKDLTVENIVKYVNDVAGIRIICSFTSDIFRIAELLSNQSDVNVLKIKDYITHPKENGYTSYHMIVTVPVFLSENVIDTKVELQIRTIAMDFWASLEHKIYYKFEGNAPDRIKTELKECADIVSYLDHKMYSLNEEIKGYHVDPEYKEIEMKTYSETIKTSTGMIVEDDDEEVVEIENTISIEETIDIDGHIQVEKHVNVEKHIGITPLSAKSEDTVEVEPTEIRTIEEFKNIEEFKSNKEIQGINIQSKEIQSIEEIKSMEEKKVEADRMDRAKELAFTKEISRKSFGFKTKVATNEL